MVDVVFSQSLPQNRLTGRRSQISFRTLMVDDMYLNYMDALHPQKQEGLPAKHRMLKTHEGFLLCKTQYAEQMLLHNKDISLPVNTCSVLRVMLKNKHSIHPCNCGGWSLSFHAAKLLQTRHCTRSRSRFHIANNIGRLRNWCLSTTSLVLN